MHFTQDFIDFFKELAANNNREWFHANKKRYEISVKITFNSFVQLVLDELAKTDVRYAELSPKDCVFRINRDIRFSKDKSPYKLQMGAIITRGGRKNMHGEPGMYLEFTPEHLRLYSGFYMPEKETLHRIREYIIGQPEQLEEALNGRKFKDRFGEIRGDKNKRLPTKQMMAAASENPIILNKQFYFFTEMPAETLLRDDLIELLFTAYSDSAEVREYLSKAAGVEH